MTEKEQLLREIEQAPDFLVSEVLNFLRSTRTKLDQPAIAASNQITGLFADEPELMDQVMQSIEHDREDDRRAVRSLT